MNNMPSAIDRRQALRLLTSAGAASYLLAATSAQAQPDDDGFRVGGTPARGWRLLGEAQARRSVDRDEIHARSDRAYSAIRLRVFDAPVELLRVRIRFRNGESREIEVRQLIERGGATRVIGLPGERRFIDRLVFWHRTPTGARHIARVQVWARI